jgi:hypothetical protein
MATKKVEKKPTEYVVLRSDTARGPFTVLGNYKTHGQIAAKKAAVVELGPDDEGLETSFFVAVPASSFYPQKPSVTMTVTFLSEDGTEAPEDDDDPVEDDADPESDPEPDPAPPSLADFDDPPPPFEDE